MNTQKEKGFILKKKNLDKLMKVLEKEGEIIAPVNENKWLKLKSIKNYEEICFEGITWFSPKKYLFPQKHVMFNFNENKIIKPIDFPKRVIFGLRMCDLNSFRINDKLFLEQEPANYTYKKNRESLTLVGLWCDKEQDKYCFCDSMNVVDYYDLCLFDRGDYFHIKSGSQNGDKILSNLKLKEEEYTKSLPDCKTKLNTTNITDFYNRDDVWKKGSDDCLSCGACTALCPSCLCFDVEDEMNLDLKLGKRIAKWDSCMYKDFTLVAGGHVYRDTRIKRFKHRIFHKLSYFPKKFGEPMCTGCGRCIRGCPNKIDWISLVNEIHGGNENE